MGVSVVFNISYNEDVPDLMPPGGHHDYYQDPSPVLPHFCLWCGYYIVNGISNGLVGHGITHGTADIVPVSNGVLMGTAKVYPIRPNPLATNNVGSFSVALPDLGTLHVSYKANTAEGYGFLCDFVYDGSTAKPEAVPQGLAQISGYKG